MNTTTVDAWTIIKGALRRAAIPFWGAMGGGAFITGSALLIAKLGWPSIGKTFVNEAFGPTLAGFFLILWVMQVGVTWRPAILNRCEDRLLNSFLAVAGALVGAAIILMGVIAWSAPSNDKQFLDLFGFVLLVVIVVHALTGTAAFLRDYPHREDARQLRLILSSVALIALIAFYLIKQSLG